MDRAIHAVRPRAVPGKASAEDDRELAEAIRRGDANAFDRFFARYGGALLGHLAGITGDRTGAEDLLQETTIRVWKKIDGYRERGAFRAWIYRIATNLALTELRRSRYERSSIEEAERAADRSRPSPEEEWARKNREKSMEEAFLSLPDDQRTVMLLRIRRGMSIREIGDVLSIPEGTVKSRIHYAVRRLRLALGEEEAADRESNHGNL